MDIIMEALKKKQRNLSEYESKRLLQSYGIKVVREELARNEEEALYAARMIGYPVVLKINSAEIAHKTERGMIELDIRDEKELVQASKRLKSKTGNADSSFLVQEMIKGTRELMMGMISDPQFGPCVMFGLGGIFTEILKDVSFRLAPINERDALEMMREIKAYKILEAIRGMEAVDLTAISQQLIALGTLATEQKNIQEVDVNPLIIQDTEPVAVDALIVLKNIDKRNRMQI